MKIRQRKNIKKLTGSLMIEALVSVAVLAIAMLSLTSLQGTLLRGTSEAQQLHEATALGQNKLDEFRSFETTLPTVTKTSYDNIASGSDIINGLNADYSRNWTVQEDVSGNLKQVNLTISWVKSDNVTESITLDTIIYKLVVQRSATIMQAGANTLY